MTTSSDDMIKELEPNSRGYMISHEFMLRTAALSTAMSAKRQAAAQERIAAALEELVADMKANKC
jgi:hypothetical protein